MTTLKFQKNTKILKNRQDLWDNHILNNIADMFVEHPESSNLIIFVRDLFYINDNKIFREFVDETKIYYEDYIDEFDFIVDCFIKLRNNSKYDLSSFRGVFLELLSFKFLKKKFKNNEIIRESRVVIDDFTSYTIDFIVEIFNRYNLYECKTSTIFMKRDDLINLFNIKNKLDIFNLYLIIFDYEETVLKGIHNLKGDMGVEKYSYILDNINFIFLEDFLKLNPF